MRQTSRRVSPTASRSSASCLTGTSCIPHHRGEVRHFVPGAGFEPACPFGQMLLRHPRIPFRHPGLRDRAQTRTRARMTRIGGWLASATVTTTRRRVLVAEDEALIRLDLKEMLQEEGYDVVGEAGDGEQAVRLAEELKPDLVILDVKMPVLDGISSAEQIVARRIAPVVMLTAFSQRELVERAVEAGAMAYLVKPFAKSDLLPTIEVAVSRHAQLTALESEIGDLSERLETRKIVDRAKGRLQADHGR